LINLSGLKLSIKVITRAFAFIS